VAALSIARWVLLGLLRNPAIACLWLLLLGAVPLATSIQPLPSAQGTLEICMAWVFPAGLLGALLGLLLLARGRAFLVRLDAKTRWSGELGALLGAAISMQLPIVGGALLTGLTPADLAPSTPAILSADLHLAAIALLLLQPALDHTAKACAFLACAWLLPALCAADDQLARVAALLDASSALRIGEHASMLPPFATGLCLVAAAYLLRVAPARSA
jgi:hypothetical protein